MVKITECPRDAMQGIKSFIPTDVKFEYLKQLLKVGFDVIDCGSFVSHKAIPQMADTRDLINRISELDFETELLTIVANERGAKDAISFDRIKYIGFPFSISETFQIRNTNSTIEESMERVKFIQNLCIQHNKVMVVYISMGFGNPYGDPWNAELVMKWVDRLIQEGIGIFALSDTIGVANQNSIKYLFKNLIPNYPDVEFAAHLHTTPNKWFDKLNAAYTSGCRRFDGAINGFGGCPMAKDELTGNMATENLIAYFEEQNELHERFNSKMFGQAMKLANSVFNSYH